ncbi:uncharacterized protein SPAPADRAFT_68476 [Spathaspora passalidarum NRRL Y-27907]|uniref:Uncharacterized protein n=1 Tax=Spathaspora passalidarum (strain NRRL Y-27907 / 11-Y1) TaxID=619300 RepID=G3ATZ4_SPAPN|nr:uncharacterized protein SPAPADRAFT_68476 [Spathaspora passalidarum NRRL Y-27907]EGW30370.1 hypothetical protein SPAPADRAFT_68476 [Spathaspora passalidarum NRRL Y-27907]
MSLYQEYQGDNPPRERITRPVCPHPRPPLSPIPSKPNFKCNLRLPDDPSPIPRTTPIGFLIDDASMDTSYPGGDNESILSEARSFLTPDLKDGCESMNRIASPSDLTFYSYLSQLKSTLPLLTHTVSPCNVLAQFFANEIYHANNLITICYSFCNTEFHSFPHTSILNPYIPQDKTHHSRMIHQLKKLQEITRELISRLAMFNSLIDKVNLFDVSFTNLLSMRAQFTYLINNFVIEEIEEISKKLQRELYKYNLFVENIIESDDNYVEQEDDISFATIENLRFKIEQTLLFKTNKLTKVDLQHFYEVLITGVIEDAAWWNYIENLRDMV